MQQRPCGGVPATAQALPVCSLYVLPVFVVGAAVLFGCRNCRKQAGYVGGGGWGWDGTATRLCSTCSAFPGMLVYLWYVLVVLASLGASRKIGHCRLVENVPFLQSASPAGKIHQRHPRERWQGCGKMGKMGLKKNGKFVPIVSFFSDFSPISYEFHTFFL